MTRKISTGVPHSPQPLADRDHAHHISPKYVSMAPGDVIAAQNKSKRGKRHNLSNITGINDHDSNEYVLHSLKTNPQYFS
ncbi:hypothetical protein NEUTE2DRAFT_163625 [Neurospora tetrasperma FGSC 2509]|nr:hypothetical protein NEUTE2DRAFT_163625 [Neurospora tetrasperma FGSC 2509]